MATRFFKAVNIGAVGIVAAIGIFAFASSAFAAASIESVKLTGPNTITIVYSEPVYTSPSDYSNFTGSFSGNSVASVSGSGSNTVTLNLAESVSSGSSGYVTIGTNVEDVTDQEYFGGATWNIVSSIGPAITSFGISSNETNGSFTGTGNTLTVTFDTNEQVSVIDMTILGHPISVSGGGTGPFTATYTMESSDNQSTIPVTATLVDSNNNQTPISFSYAGNASVSGTASTGGPVISSIVSNANTTGVLTDGDSITFTLTPSTNEPNAHVTGSYNGVPLSWVTTNDGLNYVATYVVAAGQSSQSSPLQISGVTLTDQYGNVSAPASGYDIQETISATGEPTTTTVSTATTPTSSLAAEIQSLETQLAALQSQVSGGTTTASTQFDFTEFLSVGSEDAQVTALQEQLTKDGLYTGPITGYFGALTEAAVSQFQAAHGIEVKGYVGPATRAALNAGE
jgi:hypothetical protein